MASPAPSPPSHPPAPDPTARAANAQKFTLELEFVQALANPWYLHTLAHQGYFEDEAFLEYLKYLEYWRQPQYARFILYPHALHHLELLQHAPFREALTHPDLVQSLHEKQYYAWAKGRRADEPGEGAGKKEEEGAGATAGGIPGAGGG